MLVQNTNIFELGPSQIQIFSLFVGFKWICTNVFNDCSKYLKGRNFGGKKIWRIWRIRSWTAKLNSRQNYDIWASAKLNSRQSFGKTGSAKFNSRQIYFFKFFFGGFLMDSLKQVKMLRLWVIVHTWRKRYFMHGNKDVWSLNIRKFLLVTLILTDADVQYFHSPSQSLCWASEAS